MTAPATPQGPANRLINAQSPYLLQHAYNPVDWYEWSEEAFAAATTLNKPIFLSIGYATCHWCHVMAHESFEDPQVAHLMNRAFINIKLDREERPDIDNIYMNVALLANGHGGWPLTIIMTPDQRPFFVATYIPRQSRFNRPGLLGLIPQIDEMWRTQPHKLVDMGDQVVTALQDMNQTPGSEPLTPDILHGAYRQFAARFDARRGGFGSAPKFPTPHNLMFLLRYWHKTGDDQALMMVEKTLQGMRRGGMYDHIGFGFHRYATDADWLLPHFEKMLYDQALLAMAYTEAYQATANPLYARTAREILTYVRRDMTAPEGGFYSAEDADSEGEEGKFYVWHTAEIDALFPAETAAKIKTAFNLRPDGNFTEEATGERLGTNIFHLTASLENHFTAQAWDRLRQTLFNHREQRIHPQKDDKILTDWNGLMIAAFAKAGQALGDAALIEQAQRAADFIFKVMRDDRGRLLHRYRNGVAGLTANLDDYAFLMWGLLDLYEATFDSDQLARALTLLNEVNTHFWDDVDGGYFFTADDAEQLLIRAKKLDGGAHPSGNAVMLHNLLRLARITGKAGLEAQADQLAGRFSGVVGRMPSGYAHLMSALLFAFGPSYEVIVVGDPTTADTQTLLDELHTHFVPNKVVLLRPLALDPPIVALADYLKPYRQQNDQATVYVCQNFQCELPTTDPAVMLKLLGVTGKPA